MNWGTVSTASIAAMVISCIICIGLPIILLILFKKRGGWLPAFFIGCGIFIGFALILEQGLHAIVLGTFGSAIQANIFLYGIYGGLAAALFEETGRYIAFRYFLKNHLNAETALMYGSGHGGIEAILIVGLTYINNIITSIMINSGAIEATISALDENLQQTTYDQLTALWTSSAGTFLLGGVERILAIALQLSFSVLVYMAVENRKAIYWLLAFAIHFGVDCLTVILAHYLGTAVVEIILAVMVAVTVVITAMIHRKTIERQK